MYNKLRTNTKNLTQQSTCSAPVPTLNPQTNPTRPRVVSLLYLALIIPYLGQLEQRARLHAVSGDYTGNQFHSM